MALTDSLPTSDAGGLTVVDERLIQAGEVMRSANGQARLGVLPAHTNDLVTALASMAVSVASFVGIGARTGAANGVEKVANNGATTVSIGAAPGSNSRIDLVWFKPQFTSSGDGSNVPAFGVTAGTAAASPTVPSTPAGAVALATVRIPSTATTTQSSGVVITQVFLYTAMTGGTVVLRNDDEMTAFVPIAGTTGFRLDTKQMWSYDGSNWTLAQAGLVLIRPGNVVGGTVDAQGAVIVSGGSGVRIDDCFSTRYRHYRMIMRLVPAAASNYRLVLTSGGVDRTANYFSHANYSSTLVGPTRYSEANTGNWFTTVVASDRKQLTIDIYNPGLADQTFANGILASHGGGGTGSGEISTWTGHHQELVQNDGIRIYNTEGSAFVSGDIKIYAYA